MVGSELTAQGIFLCTRYRFFIIPDHKVKIFFNLDLAFLQFFYAYRKSFFPNLIVPVSPTLQQNYPEIRSVRAVSYLNSFPPTSITIRLRYHISSQTFTAKTVVRKMTPSQKPQLENNIQHMKKPKKNFSPGNSFSYGSKA